MTDANFAKTPFTRCEQSVSFGCKLQNAIDARMAFKAEDPQLRCQFFDKSYTFYYLMPGGSHLTRTSMFEVRQRTAVLNSSIVGWHHLKAFFCTTGRVTSICLSGYPVVTGTRNSSHAVYSDAAGVCVLLGCVSEPCSAAQSVAPQNSDYGVYGYVVCFLYSSN